VTAFAILHLAGVATDFHGAPSTFTPLLGLVLLALTAEMIRTRTRPPGGARAAIALLALLTVAIVSLSSATYFDDGFAALGRLARDGSIAIVIGLLLRQTSTLRQIVWVFVGGGMLLSGLSLIQFLFDLHGSTFGGFARSEIQHVVGAVDDIRISGPIDDPNFYAQWLVLLVPLAIDRFNDETSATLRWTAAVAATLASIVVVITFSRGGLVALVAVLGLMVLRHPPKATTVAALVALGVLAVPFLPPGYVDRVAALADIGQADIGTDPSLRTREAEIAAAIDMFLDHPLTGVGFGNFLPNYPEYARGVGMEDIGKPRQAHNLYLETAAQTGILGLVVLGAIIGAVFVSLARGRRAFREMGQHQADGIGYGVAVSVVGYLITSVFLHLAYTRPIFVLFGISLAFPSLARAERLRHDRALATT
jgi:hypothetical protein